MKPEIFPDGYRLVMKWPRENGPPKMRTYLNRRCGLTWPTRNNPGYFCIVGLLDEPTLSGVKPLVLLAEREETNREVLFERMAAMCKQLTCEWILCDRSDEWDGLIYAWDRYIRSHGVRDTSLIGAESFTGFEQARPLIESLAKERALTVPKGTILRRQYDQANVDDIRTIDHTKPEDRLYAMAAFNHVVTSFEMYPFKPPKKAPPGGYYPDRKPGYG